MELAKYEGDVYLARLDPETGENLGYFGPLECDAFEPGREEGEVVEVKSKRRDMYGQTIHSETEQGTATLRLVFKEQPSEILAIAFAANPEAYTVSASSAQTDISQTVPALDVWIPFPGGAKNLTAVSVKDDADATITQPDNYEVNTRLGLIKFLSGGSVAAEDEVKLTFTPGAVSGTKFDGETVAEGNFAVFFDGKNRVSKKDFSVEYYSVKIAAPTDIFDLLSSELVTLEVTGRAVTPSGKNHPYRVVKHA
jgi:hypothetical protein